MPEEVVAEADSIRFTYAWASDGTIKVVDGVRVAMTALPGVVLDPADGPFAGFWYELRDGDGAVLWQFVTRHPLGGKVEVTTDTGWTMEPDIIGSGVVVVAIPVLPGAATVALMGSPGGEVGAEAVELLTHPFTELP